MPTRTKERDMTQQEIQTTVTTIQQMQSDRRRAIKARIRITNMVQAEIARALGYTSDMEEKAGAKIWTKAGKVIAAVLDPFKKKPEGAKAPKGCEEVADVFRIMILHLHEIAKDFKAQQLQCEKLMIKMIEKLPIAKWIKGVRGISLLGAAVLIGETGNLSNYDSKSKVWKRLGLAVFNGKAQRKARGEEGIEQGYSPFRRSVAWNIGENFVKQGDTYRKIYLAHKEIQLARDITRGHADNRAKRYATKKFVADLWKVWNGMELV